VWRRGAVLVALVVAAAGAAFACGSSDENAAAEGGSEGKKLFESKVHPALVESCAKCHQTGKSGAPVFLGGSADASYTAIEGFPGLISAPSISPLVQKGVHSGPALTQVQNDLVTQWLNAEVKARRLGADPGTPKNLRAAFKAFGACMDYARWKELKLHTIAATPTEGNQGQCRSCHNYGMASMWLSGGTNNDQDEPENAKTFLKLREFPYVQRLVVGRVNAEGSFDGIEASRRIIDKGTEAQQLQANSHPRFALSSELSGNLVTFVLETISNMNAGRCQNVTTPDAGTDAAPP
jgi:mono/diheme cytochrome c family protein